MNRIRSRDRLFEEVETVVPLVMVEVGRLEYSHDAEVDFVAADGLAEELLETRRYDPDDTRVAINRTDVQEELQLVRIVS